MRPPHYTGEDGEGGDRLRHHADGFNEAPALHGGRLARIPAENRNFFGASMRPPHYTGEDLSYDLSCVDVEVASMRPPHYTGEDRSQPCAPCLQAQALQ